MEQIVAGIDIGGTNTEVGLVTKNGNVLERNAMKTHKHGRDFDAYLKDLAAMINGLVHKNNVELNGIGIGAPNGNIHTGSIENAPNLEWKGIIPFCEKLNYYFPEIP